MQQSSLIVPLVCIAGLSIALAYPNPDPTSEPGKKRVVHVKIGDHCSLGAAPVGPGGSWQVVEKDVEKICAQGSSCRKGACNCDDLPDGTVMGIDSDPQGERVCRKIAGQKCSADNECFQGVLCTSGVCTCPQDVHCVNQKNDVYILA